MKAVITGLAAASLLFGLASAVTAAPQKKHKPEASNTQAGKKYARSQRAHSPASDQEWNPDKMRTGTNAWWEAMDREGRGGHNRP